MKSKYEVRSIIPGETSWLVFGSTHSLRPTLGRAYNYVVEDGPDIHVQIRREGGDWVDYYTGYRSTVL